MGVDIHNKLRLALGSVKDHASIGRAMMIYSHDRKTFSDIEIAVVRATGHDNGPIEDKHMHEILFLVSNSPGSTPFLAERISRRLCKTRDRLVALKTLLLIHRLLRGGNRCFEQELRSARVSGHLQMSTRCFRWDSDHPSLRFLRSYTAYLEERVGWGINQAGKLEPVVSKCLEFGSYRGKSVDLAFRKLTKCQAFIDRVLDCSPQDILPSNNNLAQAAMSNTLKESFQVYATFSEGVENLLNMFFDLTSPARTLACDILKRASRQSRRLHDLYEKCKGVIGSKSLDYPCVQVINMDHVLALEQCSGYALACPRSSCNTPRPTMDCLSLTKPKPTKLQGPVTGGGRQEEISATFASSSTLFSCSTLETKISKVWVIFDDEVLDTSRREVDDQYCKPSNFLNPFLS